MNIQELQSMEAQEIRKLCYDQGIKGVSLLKLNKMELIDLIKFKLNLGDEIKENTETVILSDIKPKLEPENDYSHKHYLYPKLLKICKLNMEEDAKMNINLVGPAGSGKSTACHQIANSLNLQFYFISVGQQTTKSDLLGYMDANGKYVTTPLRQAYESGGIFLLDEIDAGNANVITVLNAMLANGLAYFPDGQIERHKDFICFSAANTYGRGADRLFVGRNQLDAASLDRFIVIDFDYDDELEFKLANNQLWTIYIQQLRLSAWKLKERIVISPRASIYGAKLIRAGFNQKEVENMVIWKGVSNDIVNRIKANL
ncbi:MAG: AAA family ATPase [Flavobacterium sp.]|nr:AAA family ATPase [Flavobacterium sp.]